MRIGRGVWGSMAQRGRHVRRGILVTTVACLALAGGACARNPDPEDTAEPIPPTRLRVENQAFLDHNIYVYRSTQRIRLGTATGNSTVLMTIPPNLIFGATPLRFQAEPIGGNRPSISEEVTVSPGDEVTLVIPPR